VNATAEKTSTLQGKTYEEWLDQYIWGENKLQADRMLMRMQKGDRDA